MEASVATGVNANVQADDQNMLQFLYPTPGSTPTPPDTGNPALVSCTSLASNPTSGGATTSGGGGGGGCTLTNPTSAPGPVPWFALLGLVLSFPLWRQRWLCYKLQN
jgi:hypothetical protein